jgi:hypothetical protein
VMIVNSTRRRNVNHIIGFSVEKTSRACNSQTLSGRRVVVYIMMTSVLFKRFTFLSFSAVKTGKNRHFPIKSWDNFHAHDWLRTSFEISWCSDISFLSQNHSTNVTKSNKQWHQI